MTSNYSIFSNEIRINCLEKKITPSVARRRDGTCGGRGGGGGNVTCGACAGRLNE